MRVRKRMRRVLMTEGRERAVQRANRWLIDSLQTSEKHNFLSFFFQRIVCGLEAGWVRWQKPNSEVQETTGESAVISERQPLPCSHSHTLYRGFVVALQLALKYHRKPDAAHIISDLCSTLTELHTDLFIRSVRWNPRWLFQCRQNPRLVRKHAWLCSG